MRHFSGFERISPGSLRRRTGAQAGKTGARASHVSPELRALAHTPTVNRSNQFTRSKIN